MPSICLKLRSIDILQVFSSVTIPPVIKTVVRNGRTLVYRIQNEDIPQEIPSEPQSQSVSHCHNHLVY
jgi:hypothetical protein